MNDTRIESTPTVSQLAKCPTGIIGLDEITRGGLPRGRPTLICGGPGSGKTLMGMEFLARGALQYDEPGVFMAFEESPRELTDNVASLGINLDELVANKKIYVDQVKVDPNQIVDTGDYDLDGLFIRLGREIDLVGAKRVVLDTLEVLFGGIPNPAIVRTELHRLFRWLKDKGVTVILTGERGDGACTRYGLEEYVSDCVISLDNRVVDQICTRRLRIVKYRGSAHGTNEFPFVIDKQGISIMPVTSLALNHAVSIERIGTGVPRLDAMLGGKGYYRGSSILVSGYSGTGKSSLAATFADATCRRGERCLYIAFEESPQQILRNMRSIGLDLEPWVTAGLLRFHAARPCSVGLETHLTVIHKLAAEFKPQAVIVDPISGLLHAGSGQDAADTVLRMVDFLKTQQITLLLTNLVSGDQGQNATEVNVSSRIDTWLMLQNLDSGGERNRGLSVYKSRGMAHSNQIREFHLTDHGVAISDVYVGPEGVLAGSARLAQEAREQASMQTGLEDIERQQRALERMRKASEAQIATLRLELETQEEQMNARIAEAKTRAYFQSRDRAAMAIHRGGEVDNGNPVPQGDKQ